MSDEPPPDIDFVVGAAAPGVDEELPDERRRRERLRIRGVRLDLVAAVVVLGGSLLVARGLTHGDTKTAATATPTPSPSSSRTYGTAAPDTGSGLLNGQATAPIGSGDVVVLPVSVVPGQTVTISVPSGDVMIQPALPTPTSADPAQCPDGLTCYGVQNVAPAARAAVRAAFPGAIIRSAQTVHLDSEQYAQSLWFEQINAQVGSKQILVRVQAPRSSDRNRGGTDAAGDQTITYYEHDLKPYHVVVQVSGPSGGLPSLTPLETLAGDVRLLGDE